MVFGFSLQSFLPSFVGLINSLVICARKKFLVGRGKVGSIGLLVLKIMNAFFMSFQMQPKNLQSALLVARRWRLIYWVTFYFLIDEKFNTFAVILYRYSHDLRMLTQEFQFDRYGLKDLGLQHLNATKAGTAKQVFWGKLLTNVLDKELERKLRTKVTLQWKNILSKSRN